MRLLYVLSLILPLLPLDARACAASVCRAWRAAAASAELREELSFRGVTARVDNKILAKLCARAGASLRTLWLDANACAHVTAAGMLAALRRGGCTGVRRLSVGVADEAATAAGKKPVALTAAEVQQLAAACPILQHAACAVRCGGSEVAAVLAALPGPLTLECCSKKGVVTQLAQNLRASTTLTSLVLRWNGICDADATQLAEALRANATLTRLCLDGNCIGDEGAKQFAECLRVNTTLQSLNLSSNIVGIAGATHLGESLRVNATLRSLNLECNFIGDEGASQLAYYLRENATLTAGLVLKDNCFGVEGATQLAEALRVNAALKSLDLSKNKLRAAGAEKLADCLRTNATLTSLDVSETKTNVSAAMQLIECMRINATLTSVELAQNVIDDLDASALADACPPGVEFRGRGRCGGRLLRKPTSA